MKTSLKTAPILCLVLSLSSPAEGQSKLVTGALLENVNSWCDGHVYLADGQKLSGLLRYDDNLGILTYQNGDVSKSLIPRTAAGFEFYDEGQKKQRYFFSRELGDDDGNSKFFFFEVLKEFDGFTVLSKVDPVAVEMRSGGIPYQDPYTGMVYGGGSGRTAVEQTETIYFMDQNETIQAYLHIVEREVAGLLGGKHLRNTFADKKLLQKYTEPHYDQLKQYIRDNGLNLKRKTDLLTLFDYYGSITQ